MAPCRFWPSTACRPPIPTRPLSLPNKNYQPPKYGSCRGGENNPLDLKEVNFSIDTKEKLSGRENYKKHYNRTQRWDLSKERFIVTAEKGKVIVSHGLFDAEGQFTETVERIILSETVSKDAIQTISEQITTITEQINDKDALLNKISQLNAVMADEMIAADKKRIEVLQYTEKIETLEKALTTIKQKRLVATAGISIITVLLNLTIIFFLSRTIITKPIRMLVNAFQDIAEGEGDLTRRIVVKSLNINAVENVLKPRCGSLFLMRYTCFDQRLINA